MKRLQWLWQVLTDPQSLDEDAARQEYMTRVMLVMIMAVLYLSTLPILVGWLAGVFDFYPVAIMLLMDIPIGVGWYLAHRGHWRLASIILPSVFFILGAYNALSLEQSNISLLFFILTILLVSVLQSVKAQWITVLLCVGANILIRWMVFKWAAVDVVSSVITLSGFFSGITLLQNFFGGQMRLALVQSRDLNDSLRVEIAERVRIEEALRKSEKKLRNIIEQSYDGIVLTDEKGKITVWNQAQERISGIPPEQALDNWFWEIQPVPLAQVENGLDPKSWFNPGPDLPGAVQISPQLIQEERDLVHRDGTRRVIQSVTFPVETDKGFILASISRDVTRRKENEQHLEYLATHDPLTSLPNRVLLQDRLSHAISFAKRNERLMAVLYLDLDGFKSVNDHLGHDRGDQLLKELAERLKDCLRQTDTVARIGGDEFAFVCVFENGLGREFASFICERIIHTVSSPFILDGHVVSVTSSIGLSLFPQDGDHPEVLLRKADTAMFRAKGLGKNCFQFFSESVWKAQPPFRNS